MKTMTMKICALALALVMVPMTQVRAQENPAGSSASRVEVTLGDVPQMREVKHLRGAQLRDTTRSIQALADWLGKQAERSLPADQSLQVTLRDVDLAGEYEPGQADLYDVRIIKDIYPPRIELDYTLSGADGAVLRRGETTLRDTGFLSGGMIGENDPLRFEKRMLRSWLRSILVAADADE